MDTHARLSPRRGLGLMTAVAAVALVAGQLAFASTGAATVGPTSVGVAIAPPSDAGSSPGAVAAAVACAAPGSCFQVGTYVDAGGYTRPSLGVITDGNAEQTFSLSTWIPSNGLTTPSNDYLSAISCPNVGQCEAVGSYQLTAGGSGGYALEWDSFGDYYIPNSSIQQITLPLDSASPPQAALYGISCTTIGNCVAVGTYNDNGVGHVPLVAVQTNGTWATAFTPASEPAGFSTGTLSAVSCPSASNCVAVGTIFTSSGEQAIYLSLIHI